MTIRTAKATFYDLDAQRSGIMNRCEDYAKWTLPRLLPESTFDQNITELANDYQSVGAQATNHLANKLMLTLFAPSRPFFRLDLDPKLRKTVLAQGMAEAELDAVLALGEKSALRVLEQRGLRPKLFLALQYLIVLGNALLYLPDKGDARVFSMRQWVVRRTADGRVKELCIRECMKFDELDAAARDAFILASGKPRPLDTAAVELFTLVRRNDANKLELRQAVNEYDLGDEFAATYNDDTCPYRVECWNLSDEANYGSGLVEDYRGAFSALSTMSEAEIEAGVLCSEFRWLVNPSGQTKPEDLEESENGAALPGFKDDVVPITFGNAQNLQVLAAVSEKQIRVIGQGFLMPSAVTRDAERVTAEEIRGQAIELETGLGGVYTRLASSLQPYIAAFLLKGADISIANTKLTVQVITGLDALSRSGDLENLRLALQDIASLQTLGPDLLGTLNLQEIMTAIFIGRGVPPTKFVKAPEQVQQEQQAQQEQQTQAMAAQEGARAAANNAISKGNQ
jgi:hypothetical protein